jgi:photosystem II stability/assembly factor-like uncharacterized protein
MKKLLAGIFFLTGTYLSSFAQWQTLHYPTTINSVPNLNAVEFTSAQSGLAAGNASSNPIIIKSTDGGIHWDTVFITSINGTFNDLCFHAPGNAVAVGHYYPSQGIIARTTDYGITWDTTIVNKILNAISFPSTQTGYIVGTNGTILKTTNGGLNWIALASPTADNFNSVKFVNDSVGFICGGTKILKTQDGGVTWSITNIGRIVAAINFPSSNIGYCYHSLFDSTYLFKTNNAGATWNLHSSFSTNNFNTSMSFVNDSVGYICGVFKMEKTTDGGLTWQTQHSSAPSTGVFHDWVADICFISADTGFAVGGGGYGQVYRTFNGGNPLSVKDFSSTKNLKAVASPNPFNEFTTINIYNHPVSNAMFIEIYNNVGHCIKTEKITNNTIAISRENLSNGLYLYRIVDDNETLYSGKLIICE